MPKTKTPANVVGKQIRKMRKDMGITQETFATRCQLHGFDVSRGTISQIEASLRCVKDKELMLLADVLETSIDSLFPTIEKKQRDKQGRDKGKGRVKHVSRV